MVTDEFCAHSLTPASATAITDNRQSEDCGLNLISGKLSRLRRVDENAPLCPRGYAHLRTQGALEFYVSATSFIVYAGGFLLNAAAFFEPQGDHAFLLLDEACILREFSRYDGF